VRLPGIRESLPYVFHWDEPTLVNLAVWIFTDGSLDPRFFNYPAGMVYLLAVLFAAALLAGRLAGIFPSLAEGILRLSAGTYPRPPGGEILYRFPTRGVPFLYLAGRLVSAALGTLSVWWTFRLGRRLGGAAAGWLAGGLLALSALHAGHSTLVTTDVACGAFLSWFLFELLAGGSPRRAGLALGLAAAFKYTGGIGLYLWPLGLLIRPGDGSRRDWNRRWLRLIPWAAGTFLVLNPYALLTPRAFLAGFSQEAAHMREGTAHFGADLSIGPTGLRVVAQTLWSDFGLIPLAGCAAAAVAAWRRRRPADGKGDGGGDAGAARALLLLLLWCVVYLAQLSTWKTAYPRYLLPIWPALCAAAACGWSTLADGAATRLARSGRAAPGEGSRGGSGSGRLRPSPRPAPRPSLLPSLLPLFLPLFLLLFLLPSLPALARSLRARLQPDPRVAMSRVLERELAPGAAVATEPGGPWIDSGSRQIIRVDLLGRASPEGWRRRGVRYLLATGREAYLPAGSPESLRVNRARIESDARPLWRAGPYVVYDLGEGDDPFNAARRLLDAGRPADAIRLLAERPPGDAEHGPATVLLGDAHLALGDTAAAVDAYLRASEIDAEDPVPLLALGSVALAGKSWDAAVAAFARARELSPRDAVVANNLATALLYRAGAAVAAGRREAAAGDLQGAALLARYCISVDPEEPRFRELEATTRELSGRWGMPLPGR